MKQITLMAYILAVVSVVMIIMAFVCLHILKAPEELLKPNIAYLNGKEFTVKEEFDD